MKTLTIAAGLAGVTLLSTPVYAQTPDHEAGVPLSPSEAAGSWILESGGHDLCVLQLGEQKVGGGYAVKSPARCGDALLQSPTAWAPTRDGMSLLAADGQPLLRFNRWSNSLFVSHQSSGVDLHLRRGGANS